MTLSLVLVFLFLISSTAAAHHREQIARWKNRDGTIPAEAKWSNPVNRNLIRLARCETGGINGGRPLWTHHNSVYTGALGFAHSTWSSYKHYVRPMPRARYAAQASPAEQLAVGRVLVKVFGGYSSWPACHRRLGIY